MITLQLLCLAIVTIYVTARAWLLRRAASPVAPFLARFVVLAIAAAIGEDTMIRFYGTYGYAAGWSAFVDHVPLVVVLVWPVVIDSAALLAKELAAPRWVPLVAAGIVLADASLIEPIAVHARLWSWTDEGVFHVPLVGIAGWAMFTFAATWCLASFTRGAALLTIVVAPVATHALVLASWWMLFRWTRGAISDGHGIGAAWLALTTVTVIIARHARRKGLAPRPVLLRAPGALFFFALLVVEHASAPLVLYALAFAPPYFAGLAWGWRVQKPLAMTVR